MKPEKKPYEAAELEISRLCDEDILTTSNPFDDDEFGSDNFENVDPNGWT